MDFERSVPTLFFFKNGKCQGKGVTIKKMGRFNVVIGFSHAPIKISILPVCQLPYSAEH